MIAAEPLRKADPHQGSRQERPVATCICVYYSVFSNLNRVECEVRGNWVRSMVLGTSQSCVGARVHEIPSGGKTTVQGA